MYFVVICWRSSIGAGDTYRLNKLITKAGSVIDWRLKTFEVEVERSLTKLLSAVDNPHHPLHHLLQIVVRSEAPSLTGHMLSPTIIELYLCDLAERHLPAIIIVLVLLCYYNFILTSKLLSYLSMARSFFPWLHCDILKDPPKDLRLWTNLYGINISDRPRPSANMYMEPEGRKQEELVIQIGWIHFHFYSANSQQFISKYFM